MKKVEPRYKAKKLSISYSEEQQRKQLILERTNSHANGEGNQRLDVESRIPNRILDVTYDETLRPLTTDKN